MDYEGFCELVERACFNSWRTVIGRDNYKLGLINSVIFTRSRNDTKWDFSFGVRYGKTWCQFSCDMEPLEYDILSIGKPGTYDPGRDMSPENRAQDMASVLLAGVVEGLKEV